MNSIKIFKSENVCESCQRIDESDPRYAQIMEIAFPEEPRKMKDGDKYYATNWDGGRKEIEFHDDVSDDRAIEFGNYWSTPKKENRMAAIIQAHLQLAHIAEEIGESKKGEERWTYAIDHVGKFVVWRQESCVRSFECEFPTREKCELFIKLGQKWLEVLHPIVKR